MTENELQVKWLEALDALRLQIGELCRELREIKSAIKTGIIEDDD